jgi:2',3'-cyclic-nucleotide 2'-phosphodiesterase (5'-nucleotidase family)
MKRVCVIYTMGLALLFASCHSTNRVLQSKYALLSAKGQTISVDSTLDKAPDESSIAILKPYREKIDRQMSEVIGVSDEIMMKGKPESLLSNLIADIIKDATIQVIGNSADVGLVNIGGLRNILSKGEITIGAIYEILPFENSLCVLTIKGLYLKDMLQAVASLHGEGISGVRMEITNDGHLLNAFIRGQSIEDDKLYTVATIDYLAEGNGRMGALLRAEKKVCPEGMTIRDIVIHYIRKQTVEGKTIHSVLDNRIVIK